MKTKSLPSQNYFSFFTKSQKLTPLKINVMIKKITLFLLFGWMIFSSQSFAQNLTFTIDNATVNGGTVTETILNGSDTYVLTAVHNPGTDAQLFDNGGGDLMFYIQDFINGAQKWTVSLSKNGLPVNFNLTGCDYASFGGDADFNLLNNSGAVITPTFTIVSSSSGTFPITNSANVTDISNFVIASSTDFSTLMVDFHNIDVTIVSTCNTAATINESACDSYTMPSGDATYFSSGTYIDTIPNTAGCDSIITVNLTINNNDSTFNLKACGSYISPSGNYTWTVDGVYNDTIPNAAGCDSVITVNLAINNSNSSNINLTACNSYISPSGNYTWTADGAYNDTIPNAAGCDSVITVNLIIKNSSSSIMNPTVCNSYQSPSGNYAWTIPGTYYDTIPNAAGCDSAITINLVINTVNNTLSSSGATITANESGATFQWVDCNNNHTAIPGETNQSYTATENGNYAVIVTVNNCTDTSACYIVNHLGFLESKDLFNYRIYPNPAKESIYVESNLFAQITISNALGELVYRSQMHQTISKHDLSILPNGVYYLQLFNEKGTMINKLIISR